MISLKRVIRTLFYFLNITSYFVVWGFVWLFFLWISGLKNEIRDNSVKNVTFGQSLFGKRVNFFFEAILPKDNNYSYAGSLCIYTYIRVHCARSSNRIYYIIYKKKKLSSKQNAATSTPPSSSWHWFIVIKRLLRVYTVYTRIIYFYYILQLRPINVLNFHIILTGEES